MKRIVASWIFLFLMLETASGQQFNSKVDPQEVKDLVSQLSWDNVGMACHFILVVEPVGEVADKLVKIGKPATDELINALEDENRGVAAHVILTEIWGPNFGWVQIRYIYGNDDPKNNPKPLGLEYTYNGLRWTWTEEKKDVVEKHALLKIAHEWRQKVKQR